MSELLESKPCPFCGMDVDFDNGDTLYPTGTGWLEEDGLRHYVRYSEAPKEQWCWGMHCPEPAGGCGAEVHGDTKDEALAKWNRRASNALAQGPGGSSPGPAGAMG